MSGTSSCAGASTFNLVNMGKGKLNNLFHLCLMCCYFFPVIGSLTISLKPPAEEILNKHLCPNPVLSATSKLLPSELAKILTIRLEPRNRSNTYFSRFRPCTFIEDPSLLAPHLQQQNNHHSFVKNNVTLIRIQSINLNIAPWNFSTAARNCSKMIMFRSWSEYGNGYPVMCGRENFDQFLGPYGHPMILYYHLRDQGMSFPLFHPNYEQFASSSSPYGNSNNNNNHRDHKNVVELKYMLIYYSIRAPDGKWMCRLQQYSINSMQADCPEPSASGDPTCGEYPCAELDMMYQKKMSARRGDSTDFQQQQRFIIQLHKSKTAEKYRVRNFLRQKFVPILFLVILICAYKTYMKAGLRLHEQMAPMSEPRLRRFHHRHHQHNIRDALNRDPFPDIYFGDNYVDDDNNIPAGLHIPYEPSSPRRGGAAAPTDGAPCAYGKYLVHPSDPPPSYETLFPPSYNELFYPSSPADSSSNTASEAKNHKV